LHGIALLRGFGGGALGLGGFTQGLCGLAGALGHVGRTALSFLLKPLGLLCGVVHFFGKLLLLLRGFGGAGFFLLGFVEGLVRAGGLLGERLLFVGQLARLRGGLRE
jgi:hypothetical protein